MFDSYSRSKKSGFTSPLFFPQTCDATGTGAAFTDGIHEVLSKFLAVLVPPTSFLGFGFKLRNDAFFHDDHLLSRYSSMAYFGAS